MQYFDSRDANKFYEIIFCFVLFQIALSTNIFKFLFFTKEEIDEFHFDVISHLEKRTNFAVVLAVFTTEFNQNYSLT